MEFRLLGPLEVLRDGVPVTVPSAKQRVVLATLLLRANQVVTLDELIDRLWEDDAPTTPRGTTQAYVMRLRKVLGGGDDLIETVENGYRIRIEPGQLDLARFREEVRLAEGDAEEAHLRAALDLWRGRPLGNVPSDLIQREDVPALDEQRLQALERRIRLDVDDGRHDLAITELRTLTGGHPMRERFWALLMLALFRAGRQADALDAHRRLTRALVDELGVDPGEEVRRLHLAILNNDSSLHVEPAPVVVTRPSSPLPPDTADFVGRAAEINRVTELLRPHPQRSAPRYVVLSGLPGVGKTALAVHIAHQLRDEFPDGVLHVNLRGYSQQAPLTTERAFSQLLRGLGLRPEQVPLDEEGQAELCGSLLAGKRMLIVLDNALSSDQVRPLLPVEPGCAVLVTSRNDLRGLIALQGARRIALDALPEQDALRLLVEIIGPDLAEAEPDEVAALVGLCARLPLALRIAGANLCGRPGSSVAEYNSELREANRLSALAIEDDAQAAVRHAFGLSYETLKPEARHLFRVLGLVPGPEFTRDAAAALTGEPVELVGKLLGGLATASLVQAQGNRRWQFHDLLRLYARERAELEDPPEHRDAALARLFDHYLGRAAGAATLLNPAVPLLPCAVPVHRFAGHEQAVEWLDSERANLVVAIEFAASHPRLRPLSWQLADALTGYLHMHRYDSDLLAVATVGLAAAGGDRPAEAAMSRALGVLHWSVGEYRKAVDHLRPALALHRELDDPAGAGATLTVLGVVHLEDGRLTEAVRCLTEAIELSVPAGSVTARVRLGSTHLEMGDLRAARAHLEEALAATGPLGLVHTEAAALNTLGAVHLRLGAFAEAIDRHQAALERYRALGSRHDEAEVLQNLAAVHRDARRFDDAVSYAEQALELARQTANLRFEADTLNTLATAHSGLRQWDTALRGHTEALELSRRAGYRQGEITSLIGLAAARIGLGMAESATVDAWQAADLAHTTNFALREAQALTVLAQAEVETGRYTEASAHAAQALTMHTEAGNRLGRARAHHVLGAVALEQDDPARAAEHLIEAARLHEALRTGEADEIRVLVDALG